MAATAATPDRQGYYTYRAKIVHPDGRESQAGTKRIRFNNGSLDYENIPNYAMGNLNYRYDHSKGQYDYYILQAIEITNGRRVDNPDDVMIVGPGRRVINKRTISHPEYGTMVFTLMDDSELEMPFYE
ncbi:MAG: hypothetical protein NC131_22235 [Roseburia sp.]|nr:hypothetical protein [Roseburia sp.]